MNTTEQHLGELAKIGEQIVEISHQQFGRGWNHHEDNINSYIADDGNHKAFQVDDLQVSYFNPVKLELRLADIDKLPSYVQRAQQELQRLESMVAGLTKEEIRAKKKERAEELRRQLAELEEDGGAEE